MFHYKAVLYLPSWIRPVLYLYAIKRGSKSRLRALRGLDDAPLRYVQKGGMTAVVSATPTNVFPTPERLWQHASVVEALMAHQTVLPAQFATSFRDEAAVLHLLDAYHDQFSEDLNRLKGCVEIGLRVVLLMEPVVLLRPGNRTPERQDQQKLDVFREDYDVARLAVSLQREAQRRRDVALGEMIDRALCVESLDHVFRVEEGDSLMIRASYLVEKHRIGAFQEALERLTKAHPCLLFICSGPWPPYHFVRALPAAKGVGGNGPNKRDNSTNRGFPVSSA